jgi:hypothetical protein
MADAELYMTHLYAFLKTQDYLGNIGIDALKAARKREELGISSLAVIMLVVNYMEANGVPNAEFNPDWINRLDDVDGIVSVFRQIDREKAQTAEPADA